MQDNTNQKGLNSGFSFSEGNSNLRPQKNRLILQSSLLVLMSFALLSVSAIFYFFNKDSGNKDDFVNLASDFPEGFNADFGTEQNKLEQIFNFPDKINFGELNDAPAVPDLPIKDIDIAAHWYNDFGLDKTALSKDQGKGAYTWYDWSWNHTTNPNYDPSRHPLNGWYKGDDPKVLDWQSYWLATSGVNVVIPSQTINSTADWSDPSDTSYWLYQLFNNVKNFKSLKYVLWLKGGNHSYIGKPEEPNAQQDDMINNIVAKYDNVYSYTIYGKKYPAFYIWDMEGWRGTYDRFHGTAQSAKRLKELAKKMQDHGYGGITIFARNLRTTQGAFTDTVRKDLAKNGVYLFGLEYSDLYSKTKSGKKHGGSYESYVKKVKFPTEEYNLINVLTSAETQAPHPSKWSTAGSTPELFEKLLEKAADTTMESNKPKIISIYNVSEWAEGGPGLHPNKRDGFGYLEAVQNVAKKHIRK